MSTSHPDPDESFHISRSLEDADREIRDQRRREEIERHGAAFDDEEEEFFDSEDDEFLEYVDRFENAPEATHAQLLIQDGVELTAPEFLITEDEVERKLWEVINALAKRHVFLYHTDHLGDRSLYDLLWRDRLNEWTKDLSDCPGSACHMDLLDACSDGDNGLFLKYYADATEREFWSLTLELDKLPDPERPPYDRDRHLPKREN